MSRLLALLLALASSAGVPPANGARRTLGRSALNVLPPVLLAGALGVVVGPLLVVTLGVPESVYLLALAAAVVALVGLPALVSARARNAAVAPWRVLAGASGDTLERRALVVQMATAAAAAVLAVLLGVVAVQAAGVAVWGVLHGWLIAVVLGGMLVSAPAWHLVVARLGARHVLAFVLMAWCLVAALIAVHPALGLHPALFVVLGGLVAVLLVGTGLCLRPLAFAFVATPGGASSNAGRFWVQPGSVAALLAIAFALVVWVLVVEFLLGGARQLGVLFLLAGFLAALVVLRRLPDPVVPGRGPMARFAPWGDGSGRALSAPWALVLRAPFVLLYLASNWVLFFAMSPRPDPYGILAVAPERLENVLFFERLYFWLPDLTQAPGTAALTLITAPIVNVHLVQLVYVSLLLLLFGLVFEVREGTLRMVLVFFGASAVGALAASALHAAVYPGLMDHRILEQAQRMYWTGGSAGAFGIMGAVAARARSPWPLLAFFALWELNVGGWYLRSYTPAFHVTALIAGFLFTRHVLAPAAPAGSRASASWPQAASQGEAHREDDRAQRAE